MKKTKIIIPALGLLLLSTAASVTGTVAWFAANATVTAQGMSVSAKSDSVFLEIQGAQDAGYTSTGNANLTGQLLPVAHESWDSVDDIESFTNNWYYRYSDKTDDADSNMTTKSYISAFEVDENHKYVATTSFSVKLHDGSADKAYDLYVSSVTIAADTGITVVIAGEDGYQEFSASQAATIAFDNDNVLADEVTSTAQNINVYIYIDGNNDNVYSDNIDALTGAVSFQLTAFAANHA